jgi:hypothetical protein
LSRERCCSRLSGYCLDRPAAAYEPYSASTHLDSLPALTPLKGTQTLVNLVHMCYRHRPPSSLIIVSPSRCPEPHGPNLGTLTIEYQQPCTRFPPKRINPLRFHNLSGIPGSSAPTAGQTRQYPPDFTNLSISPKIHPRARATGIPHKSVHKHTRAHTYRTNMSATIGLLHACGAP